MKKFILLTSILFFTACSNGNEALKTLKENYPKTVKEVYEELPKSVQKEIVVPKKLPFKVKNVSMDYQKSTVNDSIIQTSIIYLDGKGHILYVETFHNKKTEFSGDDQQVKTTKLKDGTDVIIDADSKSTKTIRWKKDGIYHSISLLNTLLKSPDIDKKYTIKDLVTTANSMIE